MAQRRARGIKGDRANTRNEWRRRPRTHRTRTEDDRRRRIVSNFGMCGAYGRCDDGSRALANRQDQRLERLSRSQCVLMGLVAERRLSAIRPTAATHRHTGPPHVVVLHTRTLSGRNTVEQVARMRFAIVSNERNGFVCVQHSTAAGCEPSASAKSAFCGHK